MERGRLSRLFTGKSKQEWEEVGRREEGQAHATGKRPTASVVNNDWIHEIKPNGGEEIGILDGELKAFKALADRGYYVVCRTCNAARLRWLRSGIAMNGKPLWIKTKSLKGLKNKFYEGLTGMRKDGRDTIYSLDSLEPATPPPDFKVEFLQRGQNGAKPKVYNLKPGKQMEEIQSGHEKEI